MSKKSKLEMEPKAVGGVIYLTISHEPNRSLKKDNPWRLSVNGADKPDWSAPTEPKILENANYLKNCMYHHLSDKIVIKYKGR